MIRNVGKGIALCKHPAIEKGGFKLCKLRKFQKTSEVWLGQAAGVG